MQLKQYHTVMLLSFTPLNPMSVERDREFKFCVANIIITTSISRDQLFLVFKYAR